MDRGNRGDMNTRTSCWLGCRIQTKGPSVCALVWGYRRRRRTNRRPDGTQMLKRAHIGQLSFYLVCNFRTGSQNKGMATVSCTAQKAHHGGLGSSHRLWLCPEYSGIPLAAHPPFHSVPLLGNRGGKMKSPCTPALPSCTPYARRPCMCTCADRLPPVLPEQFSVVTAILQPRWLSCD